MKTVSLIAGMSLGLLLTGCPSDDTGDEGAGTADSGSETGMPTTGSTTATDPDSTSTTDMPGTTMGPGTTTEEPTSTTEEPTSTTEEPTSTTEEPALSFEMDVYPIIDANCSCHVGGGPGMLQMPDAATAYGNLVDVPSANMANDQDRIEPGDPDASFLWHKINDTQGPGEGGPMPAMAPPLAQVDLDLIEQWILDGAQP
ncbi:hypothetical protein [Paraliomyxa miuraensis]|uniref:hypothetical protein n=1 Tax=Paraliomyxa miuraensis TaxID=376150 RepID=UPI002250BC4F|nr:hypothetical protein [Paraliomyxa miuraensis]MCX4247218.1 hypothetical protein [Paraliomyxa miuraensis]